MIKVISLQMPKDIICQLDSKQCKIRGKKGGGFFPQTTFREIKCWIVIQKIDSMAHMYDQYDFQDKEQEKIW